MSPAFVSQTPKIKNGITNNSRNRWVGGNARERKSFSGSSGFFLLFLNSEKDENNAIRKMLRNSVGFVKPISRDREKVSHVENRVPIMIANESFAQKFFSE